MKHVIDQRNLRTVNACDISQEMLERGNVLAFRDGDGIWILSKVGICDWIFTTFGSPMHYSLQTSIDKCIEYQFGYNKDLILFDTPKEFFKWALEQST